MAGAIAMGANGITGLTDPIWSRCYYKELWRYYFS